MEVTQEIKAQTSSKVNLLVLVVFFIIFIPSSFIPNITSISLYVLMPFLFLYSFTRDPRLLFNYKPLIYLLLLLGWSILTTSKSTNMTFSIKEIQKLLGAFLLCFIIVHFCFTNTKYIYIFYFLFILKFFTVFQYGYTHGLGTTDERFNLPGELNANLFGYFGFFSVVSAFFLWQFMKSKPLVRISLFILFIFCFSFSIISCFYAASRAGIAMSLLMATSLILINVFYPFSKKYIWGILSLVVIGIIIVPIIKDYYTDSVLEMRMQIETLQASTRFYLAERAIEIGLKNPFFGVGPGNFMQYSMGEGFSHCSYTELFANNGIPALLLFLLILHYYYKKNRQLYSMGKDHHKNAFYFFSFLFLYCIYNLFYVFHLNLFLMGFFFLVMVHLEIYLEQGEPVNINF